ncbi:MAG: complex I NDUFA9 subunit family protein [Haloarculaceae archaeon]
MNVLVVGGTGFVGTHLCRELAERGHHVTALSRSPDEADLPPEVDRVAGDAMAYDSIEGAFEGQDAVVFLVALSPLFKPRGGYERHYDVHLGGTENAVRAAEEHGVGKFVQMSALGADPDADTAYIRSKGEADRVVRESGLDWTIFQPSVIFGEGDEFVGFTKQLAPPYFTPLPGGGKSKFQPIWVGDLVEMFAMAIEGTVPEADDEAEPDADEGETEGADDPHVGQVYEIGGPEVLTLAEVARLAHAADGKPVNVYSIPMALAGVGLKLLDKVPGAPMGADQYRSLQFDNVTDDNDVGVFGFEEDDLKTLAEYLGVDPEAVEPGRA